MANQQKTLETLNRLWYIEHKEGHLLLTGAPLGAPLQRWSIPSEAVTSQWEAPILVATGWALFFSLVILVSVEKGKQRYNEATKGNQQADYPYKYQDDIRSSHKRHLPSNVLCTSCITGKPVIRSGGCHPCHGFHMGILPQFDRNFNLILWCRGQKPSK